MEERILGVEDTVQEIDSLVKENGKSYKSLSQNIQEIGNTMKRQNLRIIGLEEREEHQLKGTENIYIYIQQNQRRLSHSKERYAYEGTRSL